MGFSEFLGRGIGRLIAYAAVTASLVAPLPYVIESMRENERVSQSYKAAALRFADFNSDGKTSVLEERVFLKAVLAGQPYTLDVVRGVYVMRDEQGKSLSAEEKQRLLKNLKTRQKTLLQPTDISHIVAGTALAMKVAAK